MAKVIDKGLFFKQIGYEPHSSGQWSFHQSNARFRIPVCGRRYGKSTMAGRDVEPELFIPKRRFWIVGPTYDLGEKEFRVVWDDLIIGRGLGRDKRVKKAYSRRSGEMWIEFPWQTRIEVRSAEHPERLVGESLDGVIMSEAAKHKRETWERFIRASLADRRGWATFPTTPEGYNWLYTLWQFGQDRSIPQYESWRFPSWENPVVYPEGRTDAEILLIEKTTTPEWFMQEIGADFSTFVGRIYSEFDESSHVGPQYYNPTWPNYIAFDWGFIQPLAAIEFQIDPFDNIHIWREHYQAYTNLEVHLAIMKDREQPVDYKIDCCFGDAADPEAASYVSQHFAPCIADPLAKSNWRQGVELVRKFLREYEVGVKDEHGTPLTKPKLFIDNSCVNLIREFNSYRTVANPKSNTRESGATSAAQKQDDHALDALRYGLMHVFELGVKHHLAEIYTPQELASTAPSSGYFTTNVSF